jgi:hypothetical protein
MEAMEGLLPCTNHFANDAFWPEYSVYKKVMWWFCLVRERQVCGLYMLRNHPNQKGRYPMKLNILFASAPIMLFCASVLASPAKLSPADEAAAFKAAGYTLKSKQWRACDDPGTLSYTPGAIQEVRDLNGDGRPEVVVTEASTFCYGNTGTGYSLLSKQDNGSWKLITNGTGIPNFLTTKGVGGWPDIEIGGPGFCFSVERWNGRKYTLQRHQYEGKPCRHN